VYSYKKGGVGIGVFLATSSIILKLDRFKNMQLERMQDIGGLRTVVSSLKKTKQL